MNTNEKIAAVRGLMKERGIDVYYIPNEDDHLSEEYTADYFKAKSFISGFSGEAGCTVITPDFAGLWTDGRYFTQAEDELKDTCVTLMRIGQEGVPAALQFLIDNTPEGGVLGFDGKVVSAADSLHLNKALKAKNAKMMISEDLAGMVWGKERPAMPEAPVYILAKKYTGETAAERIERTRQAMKEKGADVLILTALEDPCWLLNLRGNDIACTPVAYAYVLMTAKKVCYYIDGTKVPEKVRKYLKDNKVTLKSYNALAKDLSSLHNQKILTSLRKLNTVLYSKLADHNTIISEGSPTTMFRALKNNTEIRNIRNAHVKDGVAMVRFIRWVKENVNNDRMSEVSAQNVLYEYRAQGKDYIEPSFPTICAYQENGAMMHYSADETKYSFIHPRGFLLVDSGGTYKDGTTDITRTIALSSLTAEEKKLYTLVLKGHLALGHAKFLYGTTGNNLDILARGPLWNIYIDYQCGTGHGVGHVLGVHEGPHGIRWGMGTAARPAVKLEPGMIVTNEPGVYLPHKLGIRIENELLVVKGEKNFYGQFLEFEDVTYCPYELDALDLQYLSDEEIRQINAYHANVYAVLSSHLDEDDRAWLAHATREITR